MEKQEKVRKAKTWEATSKSNRQKAATERHDQAQAARKTNAAEVQKARKEILNERQGKVQRVKDQKERTKWSKEDAAKNRHYEAQNMRQSISDRLKAQQRRNGSEVRYFKQRAKDNKEMRAKEKHDNAQAMRQARPANPNYASEFKDWRKQQRQKLKQGPQTEKPDTSHLLKDSPFAMKTASPK